MLRSRLYRPAWSPLEFGDSLLFWLNFADQGRLSFATGISQCRDIGPRGNHAGQATGASQPTYDGAINGRPAARFVDQHMFGAVAAAGTDFSFFCVATMSSASQSAGRMFGIASSAGGDTTSTAGMALLARATNTQAIRGIHNSTAFTAHNVTYDTPFLWSLVKNSVDFNTFLNDGAATNTVLTGTMASVRYAVGTNAATSNTYGTTYCRGDVGEAFLVKRAVTTEERKRALAYLGNGWGAQSLLAADNPWRGSAP